MANGLYDFGRESFLGGSINFTSDTIKVSLVDSAVYTRNLTTHDFFDDIASTVADSAALAGKSKTGGVADANDVTWSAVTGAQSEQIVGRKDTGSAATSILIFNIDTATNLPVTPNGGDIVVQWDNGANKIFKL
jgi:hypothetical protein